MAGQGEWSVESFFFRGAPKKVGRDGDEVEGSRGGANGTAAPLRGACVKENLESEARRKGEDQTVVIVDLCSDKSLSTSAGDSEDEAFLCKTARSRRAIIVDCTDDKSFSEAGGCVMETPPARRSSLRRRRVPSETLPRASKKVRLVEAPNAAASEKAPLAEGCKVDAMLATAKVSSGLETAGTRDGGEAAAGGRGGEGCEVDLVIVDEFAYFPGDKSRHEAAMIVRSVSCCPLAIALFAMSSGSLLMHGNHLERVPRQGLPEALP